MTVIIVPLLILPIFLLPLFEVIKVFLFWLISLWRISPECVPSGAEQASVDTRVMGLSIIAEQGKVGI